MKTLDLYPLITTPRLQTTRDFYVQCFDANVLFEASWVAVLSLPGAGARSFTLAFMTPDHPSGPPGPEPFDGKGLILTVQVESCEAAMKTLKARGAPVDYGPAREPWGQKRFMTRDPSGVLIDVVEQVEPAEGFWERYAT